MEDLINEEILENIHEGFEISKSIVEEEDPLSEFDAASYT